uniref:sorting nexin-15 isoform X2 n=1 Tax=Pristiophorus japonicus TaxID=55135 RepID=UPI00398F8031
MCGTGVTTRPGVRSDQIVSKKVTAEVKEISVFKRYSDFKKLHGELSYIHRNLFRKSEEFPAFPKAQVFGRFDEAVIEDRRRCAEELLRFTVDIPALYNSPQLKDFFKDGEVFWPLDLAAPQDAPTLPAPLIPLPSGDDETPGSWPRLSLVRPQSGGWSELPTSSEVELDGGEAAGTLPQTPPWQTHGARDEPDPGPKQEEEAPSSFDSGTEEEDDESRLQTRSPLSDNELALFDPCAKEGDLSAERRDAVKKKTAEYLKHAEAIFTLHLKDSLPKDATLSS